MDTNYTTICEWLQLDEGHAEFTSIEPLGDHCYRISFLDESVSDWRFVFEDGIIVDGYCYQDVI